MAITAQLITNKEEFRPTVRRDRNGMYGMAHYRVGTANPMLAITAAGLPPIGKKWPDPASPPDFCVSAYQDSVLMAARDDGTGEGGWTRIPVEYKTPDVRASVTPLPSGENDKWTQEQIGQGQVRIYSPVFRENISNPANPVPSCPIDNGNGMDIPYASIDLRIFTFQRRGGAFTIGQRLLELCQPASLNQDPISLPPIYGTSQVWRPDVGQLAYLGWERSLVGDLVQLVHLVRLQRNFNREWRLTDDKGNPVGDIISDRGLEYADFTGLWD